MIFDSKKNYIFRGFGIDTISLSDDQRPKSVEPCICASIVLYILVRIEKQTVNGNM